MLSRADHLTIPWHPVLCPTHNNPGSRCCLGTGLEPAQLAAHSHPMPFPPDLLPALPKSLSESSSQGRGCPFLLPRLHKVQPHCPGPSGWQSHPCMYNCFHPSFVSCTDLRIHSITCSRSAITLPHSLYYRSQYLALLACLGVSFSGSQPIL